MAIASSASVDRTNLISQSFANLYNLINNRDNVKDPITGSGRKFVHVRMPNIRSDTFEAYPFIVVKHPEISYSNKSLSSSRARLSWTFDIEVFSADRAINNEGKGAEFCSQIVDDIMETLNSVSNKETLISYGMANIIPNLDSMDSVDDEKANTYFVARISVLFNGRLTISA